MLRRVADVRAGGSDEVVGKLVARVGIANSHRLASGDTILKALALVDVENRVFAHHPSRPNQRSGSDSNGQGP